MNTKYEITQKDLAIARPFAEKRARNSKAFYRARGNKESHVVANCMNGILAEMKAKLWCDANFPQHRVGDVVTKYNENPTWEPDLTMYLRKRDGTEAGSIYIHVKSFVLGKYPEFPDANGDDRWVTPPSFMFQKTDLGPNHSDADMIRIQKGGNSTDLLIGGLMSCKGHTPLDAVGDMCQLVGPFIMQQAVDQDLWKPPAARSEKMRMHKRVLHLDDLLTKVDVCTTITIE